MRIGITADEKYKKLKDGTTARYVYYGCTRSRDLHCKGGYIREEELIEKLADIINKVDVNELGIKLRFEEELARYIKFQKMILGNKPEMAKNPKINIRNYAKYLLKEGTIIEKRELLSYMRSRLEIKEKIIYLKKSH